MKPSVVYFVSDGGRSIKIGYSTDVDGRLRALQSSNSARLSLIGMTRGSRAHEALICNRLVAFRLGGEWFTDCAEVRAAIEDAIANGIQVAERQKPTNRPATPLIDAHPSRLLDLRDFDPDRLRRAETQLAALNPSHRHLLMSVAEILAEDQ